MPQSEQQNDNRMVWIRNLESVSEDDTDSYVVECEFLSEAYITGVLSYADDSIQYGLLQYQQDANGLYRYLLRVKHAGAKEPYYNKQANKKGYYYKDGIFGELLAICSVIFQARFYPVAIYQGELTYKGLRQRQEKTFHYRQPLKGAYPKIFDRHRKRDFGSLSVFLDKLRTIPTDSHHNLIRSFDLYAKGVREIGIDTEMVFIRFVSAVEAVAEAYTVPDIENPLHNASFSIFDDAELTREQTTQLKSILKVKPRTGAIHIDASKKKFLGFLNAYSVGCLRGGNFKAKQCKILRKDVPKQLRRIYDARSSYLHDGHSMYISDGYGASNNWDTDPSLGMIIDNRKFAASNKLPHPAWFENMVRHSLLTYTNSLIT